MDPADLALLNDLLDGRLEPGPEAALRERLAREPALAAAFDDLRRVREGIAALRGPAVPADFAQAVRRRALARQTGVGIRAWAYAAAAVVGLGLGFASWRASAPDRPAADATARVARHDVETGTAADGKRNEDALRETASVEAAPRDAGAGRAEEAARVGGRGRAGALDGSPADPTRPPPPRPGGAGGAGGTAPVARGSPAAPPPSPTAAPPAASSTPPAPGAAAPAPGGPSTTAGGEAEGATPGVVGGNPRVGDYAEGMDAVLVLDASTLSGAQAQLAVFLADVRREAREQAEADPLAAEGLDREDPDDAAAPAPQPPREEPRPAAPATPAEAEGADEPPAPVVPAEPSDRRSAPGSDPAPPPPASGPVRDGDALAPSAKTADGYAAVVSWRLLGTTRVTLTPEQLQRLRARLRTPTSVGFLTKDPADKAAGSREKAAAPAGGTADDGGETPLLQVRVLFVAPPDAVTAGTPVPVAPAPTAEPPDPPPPSAPARAPAPGDAPPGGR